MNSWVTTLRSWRRHPVCFDTGCGWQTAGNYGDDVTSPVERRVLISSHRGSAEGGSGAENGAEALRSAVNSGVDYVEFDVQALADGNFVLAHDASCALDGAQVPWSRLTLDDLQQAVSDVVTLEEASAILAGRVKAHVDFKFDPTSPQWVADTECESRACDILLKYFDPQDFIITTLEDASIARVIAWADERDVNPLVGLSLGRNLAGRRVGEKARIRRSELCPEKRLAACGANLVVAHKTLARLRLARVARRRHLPLLVWTVDGARELNYWLNKSSAWLVTTDVPRRAQEIRRFTVCPTSS